MQSRSKISISLEIFNLDLQNFQQRIGVWWAARLKFSISLDNSNPGGRSWIFSIFRPLSEPIFGKGMRRSTFQWKKKGFSVKRGEAIQWIRGLVRISTGKAIQWRAFGHSLNRRTLKTEKLLSSSPSRKSAPALGNPGRNCIRPPPPSPHFWPKGIFQGRGVGVYILRPHAAGILYAPLYTPPTLGGYFQGWGGGGV